MVRVAHADSSGNLTVTDIIPDEPVKRRRGLPAKTSKTGDRILIGVGVSLAFVAAMFPWYVFFNEGKFGLKPADWGRTRDLPDGPGRDVFSVSPLAMVDNDNSGATQRQIDIDKLTTATTASNLGEAPATDKVRALDQPLPGASGFRLMHVANGRALIEDVSGMYLVRIGSILPDDSKVAKLEVRDGRWVIVTSKGEVCQSQ